MPPWSLSTLKSRSCRAEAALEDLPVSRRAVGPVLQVATRAVEMASSSGCRISDLLKQWVLASVVEAVAVQVHCN